MVQQMRRRRASISSLSSFLKMTSVTHFSFIAFVSPGKQSSAILDSPKYSMNGKFVEHGGIPPCHFKKAKEVHFHQDRRSSSHSACSVHLPGSHWDVTPQSRSLCHALPTELHRTNYFSLFSRESYLGPLASSS